MGCFSWECSICGLSALSNSYSGHEVRIYLLVDGEVKEQMNGIYNSYGRVFDNDWKTMDNSSIVDLDFGENKNSGIALVHEYCAQKIESVLPPRKRSDQDPNQGWGDEHWYYYQDANGDTVYPDPSDYPMPELEDEE